MKRIQTSKAVGLPRFICAFIVCAMMAVGSGVADDKGPQVPPVVGHAQPTVLEHNLPNVTLVFDHALPNVPGKSMKGILVEYGPGGSSPGHMHPKSAFIYATVLEGAIRTSVNDGPVVTYHAGQNFPEMPGDRHTLDENASKTEPAKLLAVFVVDTDEKELFTPITK